VRRRGRGAGGLGDALGDPQAGGSDKNAVAKGGVARHSGGDEVALGALERLSRERLA
jgi:hypothetical protein